MRTLIKVLLFTFVGFVVFVVAAAVFLPSPPSEQTTSPAAATEAPAVAPASDAVRIDRVNYREGWPFTFDSGDLRCRRIDERRLAVIVTAEGQEYGLNGSAKDAGFRDARSVTLSRAVCEPTSTASRIQESDRRSIFERIVACEDGTASAACKTELQRKSGLSPSEMKLISDEGVCRSWPPLSPPPPMDVSLFIKQGLALCATN